MKLSWNEMTVADYIRLREISKLQMATEDEKNLMVAALIAEKPYQEILQLPLDKARELMDKTEFLLQQPVPGKTKRKYELNGRTYILFKDPSEMTVAQYIDFQQIHKEGFENCPAEMLSIFLIPEGHQYNDGYYKDQQLEDMLEMGITEALGVCDFFIKRCLKSIRQMKMFSGLMLKVVKLQAPKEEKEMVEATRIQLNLVMEGLEELYGSLALKR